MESQPQNPEFRNNPENFHSCKLPIKIIPVCFWLPHLLRGSLSVISALNSQTYMFLP